MGTFEAQKRYFCPRLLDYVLIVGSRHPNRNNSVAQTPELLRRYPLEDHKDFPLAPDVVFFCQPEGCISVGPKRMSLRESTSFVFTLTEKDTGRTRYGICVNFYRPFEKRSKTGANKGYNVSTRYSRSSTASEGHAASLDVPHGEADRPKSPRSKRRQKTAGRVRNNTLTSLCIISHHPFFSKFRKLLLVLQQLIEACNERSCASRCGASRGSARDTVWGVLTGHIIDSQSNLVMHEVREIETWILRLLSAPVPVPGKTMVQLTVLPTDLEPPMIFALPDHTRFTLIDFPLHLPLELLGVETCLSVLTCILLEHKLIIQSRDYNTLTMSVLAFTYMMYPLEYMFPVIPLLPTCMSSAEQLLLAPTPYIIGVPSSFLMYKKGFYLPDDVWLVDLDTNKITPPSNLPPSESELPTLPEPECTVLKNHLKQALASMSPQPIKNLDEVTQHPEVWKRRESFSSQAGFNPLIKGNDVDSVDVATRVAMVRFFNSPNILANFTEHTRTLRLYPRPVVAFQCNAFLKSRPTHTNFIVKLAKTQAVEYFAEFVLCPENVVFQRVQTGLCDPLQIGDKPKWYMSSLTNIDFKVFDDDNSSLGAAMYANNELKQSDEHSTDQSGSVSDEADSTSSSYSSLSDFVYDIQNSDINGDTPGECSKEDTQILTVDTGVFNPPRDLQVPEDNILASDSDNSEDSEEILSEESSSPKYADEPERPAIDPIQAQKMEDYNYSSPSSENLFRFDQQSTEAVIQSGKSTANMTTSSASLQRSDLRASPRNGSPLGGSPGSAGSTHSSPMSLRRQGTVPVASQHHPAPQRSTSVVSEFKRKEPPPRPPNSPSLRRNFSLSQQNSPCATPGGSPGTPGHSPKLLTQQGGSVSHPPSGGVSPVPPPADRMTSVASTPSLAHPNETASMRSIASAPSMNSRSLQGSQKSNMIPFDSNTDISASKLGNIMTTEYNVLKTKATSSISELFGSSNKNTSLPAKPPKPYAPLGTRKALVEKSGLVKHATNPPKKKTMTRQSTNESPTNGENQQFLKDIITGVLNGQDVGYFKLGRVKKLMEDENYRNFVVSRLNKALDRKLTDEDMHVDDSIISKAVFKGILTMCKGLIYGLEHAYQSQGLGGMSSAFMVLEIMHTHHWESASSRSDTSNPSLTSSPFGSRESISSLTTDTASKADNDSLVASIGGGMTHDSGNTVIKPHTGQPVVVNGDEFQNIELQRVLEANQNASGGLLSYQHNQRLPYHGPSVADPHLDSTAAPISMSSAGDMLREMVKNKEAMIAPRTNHLGSDIGRYESIDSETSDASTLHQLLNYQRKKRSLSVLSTKSHLSTGFRYHDGKLLNFNLPSPETNKTYVFEKLVGSQRSWLWDQMQFWEDAFLDAVAQERDIIGFDQGPGEMMDRYTSLGDLDRKRLEHDEDRLLSILLYNMIAFMVMVRVSRNEIKRKVRRMLGKCHIGLAYSAEINNLLDNINNLHGNDIDLRPMGSRLMQKQSFSVHWGTDNTGDMLFMEVCDDCIILRSVNGSICERWWFEKLLNMSYCPKTKVLCLWRMQDEKSKLNKFYTKKCKDLYFCVKEAMEKAASRNNGKITGTELDGEFPIHDMKTGQGGLLRVCIDGIGLLFSNSKYFIDISRIRKIVTHKGGVVVLEEYDAKSRKLAVRKYKSNMAKQLQYSVLCVFSYVAAAQKKKEAALANQESQKNPSTKQEPVTSSTSKSRKGANKVALNGVSRGNKSHGSCKKTTRSNSPQSPHTTLSTSSQPSTSPRLSRSPVRAL